MSPLAPPSISPATRAQAAGGARNTRAFSTPASGHVTLVGAGPGDPELLTLKALKAIEQATVLLVDDLVSDAILAYAPQGARLIHVGKRGGCRSTPQSFIEKLMVVAAREGERVVRLKGGDPFIFGRGGEEVEHLQAAGVAVSVVNGITSGLAAVTSLNVPLTHRDHAHGVVFLTGHAHSDAAQAALDWSSIGAMAYQARLTLVIYMGMRGAAAIQGGLCQSMPADTPVLIVQNASRAEQRQAACRLDQLEFTLRQENLGSPSVMVVGEVSAALLQRMAEQEAGLAPDTGRGAPARFSDAPANCGDAPAYFGDAPARVRAGGLA